MPHPLSHLDDNALCALAKQGNSEAAGVLVQRHERFIWKVAVPIAKKSDGRADVEDLVQEGRIHLWRSIPKYDPSHNIKFLSWAGKYIWTRMRAVANRSGVIALPSNHTELVAPLPILRSIDADMDGFTSPASNGARSGPRSFADAITAPTPGLDPETILDNHARLDQIANAMKALSPILQHVLNSRLAGATFKSIGDPLGYSRQRVQQLELQALNGVRVFLGLEKQTRYIKQCQRA